MPINKAKAIKKHKKNATKTVVLTATEKATVSSVDVCKISKDLIIQIDY